MVNRLLHLQLNIMIKLLDIWAKKIKTNNANQVAKLYHEDGLLLGTFSDIERNSQKLIFEYFENLFTSKVDVEIITEHEFVAESISTVAGFYDFTVNDKKIKARFTFVFLKNKERWEILSHHSSLLPE